MNDGSSFARHTAGDAPAPESIESILADTVAALGSLNRDLADIRHRADGVGGASGDQKDPAGVRSRPSIRQQAAELRELAQLAQSHAGSIGQALGM